ncbi:phage tail protein [Rhodopseudomonas sp. BR0M22]|uniref:phage tail protein n=1 Tax=Rhodopseudomonas sp. BR0M22 TaxID=2269369 RepID=UPI0013DEE512|nr:phage tail protein [Rhodopseudomonas sp. BR0M22]NEW92761.1 tail fiber protein [Rhodopseudomonas sp. BR0M22]
MALETFSYLDSLVVTSPDVNDSLANGDDHIRGIKLTLKNTFPRASGALTRGLEAGTGYLSGDGSSSLPAFSFTSEGTLGFYRASTGKIGIAGRLTGGVLPAGAIMDFAMSVAPEGWLPCDGTTLSKSVYPDLFAAIGYTWGGSGDQFCLPGGQNRYRRHRGGSGSPAGDVGNMQGSQFGSHTHGATADAQGGHTHHLSIWSQGMNRSNPHKHTSGRLQSAASSWGDAYLSFGNAGDYPVSVPDTGLADINHEHLVDGNTDGAGLHTHNISILASGGNETRPETMTVLTCIKT